MTPPRNQLEQITVQQVIYTKHQHPALRWALRQVHRVGYFNIAYGAVCAAAVVVVGLDLTIWRP